MYSNVAATGISGDEAVRNLERYVQRYDASYTCPLKKKSIENIIRELLEWTFNNIMKTRLESLRLVYEYCNESWEKKDKDLMEEITNFLTIDTRLYDIEVSRKIIEWFDYIAKNDPKTRAGKIDRFIGDGISSESVFFIYAITALQLNNDNEKLISDRMCQALDRINDYPQKEKDLLIERTIRLFADDKDHMDFVCDLLCRYFADKVTDIYRQSGGCDGAGKHYIKSINSRVDTLLEALDDKY